jgi:hypothetical protein
MENTNLGTTGHNIPLTYRDQVRNNGPNSRNGSGVDGRDGRTGVNGVDGQDSRIGKGGGYDGLSQARVGTFKGQLCRHYND